MSLLNEQLALYTLSLFGASVKIEYLELLESQLGLKLLEPLARTAAEGLVINQAGGFHFCHDRIQQASYKLIEGHARQSNHLMYGRCLVQHAKEISDDDMLFTAVNQINLAGRVAISDADECYTMANYNRIAGKRGWHTHYLVTAWVSSAMITGRRTTSLVILSTSWHANLP
jgi:predicted ATPase